MVIPLKNSNIFFLIKIIFFVSNGDSGSPLQYRHIYEIIPPDFNKTLLSDVYKVNGVLGLVSFGYKECGYDVPSVYTKVSYYRDWIRATVENN